jgi:hypothetical protein
MANGFRINAKECIIHLPAALYGIVTCILFRHTQNTLQESGFSLASIAEIIATGICGVSTMYLIYDIWHNNATGICHESGADD